MTALVDGAKKENKNERKSIRNQDKDKKEKTAPKSKAKGKARKPSKQEIEENPLDPEEPDSEGEVEEPPSPAILPKEARD